MALGEKKQTMLTSMFTKISHEERECVVAKEFDQLKAIAAAERKIQREIVEKRQVGRPRKNTMVICLNTIKQEEEEEQNAKRKKSQHLQKKRHLYNMWFTKDLFPPIQEAVKRYERTQAAIHYLEIVFRTPRGPSPYKKLGRSSLYNWLDEK